MNLKKILYVVMIGLILFGCTKRNQVDATIDYADSLMDYSQDSAMVSLRILDSLKGNKREMSEAQQMRYDLIYAKAMNKAFVDFTTDSVMKNVVKYYDKVGSTNDKMLAHYLLGCTYRDLKNAPASLASYRMATECADTTDVNCNYDLLAIVYGQIGSLYLDLSMFNQSLKALDKTKHFASMARDTILVLQAQDYQATAYRVLGDGHKFLEIKSKNYNQYLKLDMKQDAALVLCSTICDYVDSSQLSHAKYIIDNYEKQSGLMNENEDVTKGKEIYYYTKGKFYLKSNQIQASIKMFKKLLWNSCLNDEKVKACSGLVKAFQVQNEKDSVVKYSLLMQELCDSCIHDMQHGVLIKMQSLYELEQVEHKKAELLNVNKRQRYVGCLILFVIIFCGMLIRQYYVRQRLRLQLKSVKQHDEIMQYLQDNRNLIEVKTTLENALKETNESLKNFKAESEDEIAKLQKRILLFENSHSVGELLEVNETLKNSEIRKKIDKKAVKGQKIIMSELMEVEELIKKIAPKFYGIICQTELLSDTQISVCLLLRMFFSSSDLQSLLGISSGYASNVKRKVSKKLFGEELSPKEFEERIHKIY